MNMQYSPLVRDSVILLGGKRTVLAKEKDAIETVAIGSSHGDFGFNPEYFPGAFNLCCRSQDLKHSYGLHERLSQSHKKIKNVILFYSLFSPGSFMEKSPSEGEIAPVLNEVFDLNVKYKDEKLNALATQLRGRLKDLSVDIDGVRGFFPKSGKAFLSKSADVEKRVNSHRKLNKITDANVYLVKSLQLAKKLKQRVCVVIPPVRSDYRVAAGADTSELFKSLFDILKTHSAGGSICVVDCFHDDQFTDAHFGDCDHLHPLGEGPKLLTTQIFNTMFKQPANGSAAKK